MPLNGPGFDGGSSNYHAPCPAGLRCIQGRPESPRDAPIDVSYAIDDFDPATTALTLSLIHI